MPPSPIRQRSGSGWEILRYLGPFYIYAIHGCVKASLKPLFYCNHFTTPCVYFMSFERNQFNAKNRKTHKSMKVIKRFLTLVLAGIIGGAFTFGLMQLTQNNEQIASPAPFQAKQTHYLNAPPSIAPFDFKEAALRAT